MRHRNPRHPLPEGLARLLGPPRHGRQEGSPDEEEAGHDDEEGVAVGAKDEAVYGHAAAVEQLYVEPAVGTGVVGLLCEQRTVTVADAKGR